MDRRILSAAVAAGFAQETFTFVGTDGERRVYDISKLRQLLLGRHLPWQTLKVPVADCAPHLRENRDWSQERVDELTEQQYLHDYPIALREGEGEDTTYLIVDGTHRILRLSQEKREEFTLFVVDERLAPRYTPTTSGPTVAVEVPWGDPNFFGNRS